jgi:hypothetical protein
MVLFAEGEFKVLVKITRGLGGDKGVLILTITSVAGIIIIFSAWFFRQKIEGRSPAASELSPDEVLRLGAKARGQMTEIPYVAKDLARVASFAAARRANGEWGGLPPGAVLQVASTSVEARDLWVNGLVQGGPSKESVRIHASFLERYLPVMLGDTVELSDVRLVHAAETPTPKMMVTGWLRNSTSQTLSQCLVMCTFQDPSGAQVDRQIARDLVLRPLQFVRFETTLTGTGKQFAEITLEISHATSEGLRNYLPAVVIPHSAGQRTQ